MRGNSGIHANDEVILEVRENTLPVSKPAVPVEGMENCMNTMEKLQKNGIFLNFDSIAAICKKYHINELSIFGSSLRDDFGKNSDIDILVSFNENSGITLFDIIEAENEFTSLLNREVNIVEKESLKNPIRKNKILLTREIIYAA